MRVEDDLEAVRFGDLFKLRVVQQAFPGLFVQRVTKVGVELADVALPLLLPA